MKIDVNTVGLKELFGSGLKMLAHNDQSSTFNEHFSDPVRRGKFISDQWNMIGGILVFLANARPETAKDRAELEELLADLNELRRQMVERGTS